MILVADPAGDTLGGEREEIQGKKERKKKKKKEKKREKKTRRDLRQMLSRSQTDSRLQWPL